MRPSVLVYLLCMAFTQAYSPRGTDQGYQQVVTTYPPISELGDSKDPDSDFSFDGDYDYDKALTSDNNIAADANDSLYEDIVAGSNDDVNEDAYDSLYETLMAGVVGDVINEDTLPVHSDDDLPTVESVNVEEGPLNTEMGQPQNRRSMRHHYGDKKWSMQPHVHDRPGPPPPRHGTYHRGDGVNERDRLTSVKDRYNNFRGPGYHRGDGVGERDRFISVRDKELHNRYKTNNYYRGGAGRYRGDNRRGKRPRGKKPRRQYDGQMRGDDDWLAMSDMEMQGRKGDYYSGGVLMRALKCFFKRKLKYGPVRVENITQYRKEFAVSTINKLAAIDEVDQLNVDPSDLMSWFVKVVSEDWFPDFLQKLRQKYADSDWTMEDRGSKPDHRMFDKVEALEQIMEIAERAGIDRRHRLDGEMNVCLCL